MLDLDPMDFYEVTDLSEFWVASDDGCKIFNCAGQDEAVSIRDAVFSLVFGCLIDEFVWNGKDREIQSVDVG